MAHPSLARNPTSIVGIWLTTLAAFGFLIYLIVEWFGLVTSPYAGLFGFVAVPAAFLGGLALIPFGMWREAGRRRRGQTAWQWPTINLGQSRARRIVLMVAILTLANVGIVTVAGFGAVHYMETDNFCGQVCHEPMHPQFTAHQQPPHANVDCVRCHVSPGAAGMLRAKMNGTRQAYEFLTGGFSRPIPSSPARNIPVAADTCAHCHSSGHSQRDITLVKHEYADDESNSDTPTTLVMFTGKIHWHARPDITVEYVTTDEKRETIPYIKVTEAGGRTTEYFAEKVTAAPPGTSRRMDCLDCHSRPAHRFSPAVEGTVDDAIAAGRVSRALPFVRRELVTALKSSYPDQTAAAEGIRRHLEDFYKARPSISTSDLSQAIATAQRLYELNVFTAMKVTWGTYLSQIGHSELTGCQRCHDDGHTARDGRVLSGDCELCHKEQESK